MTQTLAPTWAQDQITRYTYRPGWTLSVEDGHLKAGRTELDSRDAATDIPVGITTPIPAEAIGDEAAFTAFVKDILEQLEVHESREWLRVDGVLVADPHDGDVLPGISWC